MEQGQITKYLSIMEDELDRLKDLSDSYLKNVRTGDEGERHDIIIGDMITSIGRLFAVEMNKKEINLTIERSLDDLKINFNEGFLRQIFINLIYNAIQADAKNIVIYSNEEKSNDIFVEDDGTGIKNPTGKIFSNLSSLPKMTVPVSDYPSARKYSMKISEI
jgi:signal transduction histidine kinase